MCEIIFDSLIFEEKIGFYKNCKGTEIYLHDKKGKTNINLYILLNFEENLYTGYNFKFMTNKMIKIDKKYSLGIQQYNLSIKEAKESFNKLKEEGVWNSYDTNVYFKSLKLIPKQFVSHEVSARMNSILFKDNFQSSYILEFFNKNKSNYINNPKLFQKINKEIKNLLNLNFEFIPERLGNIIFQFPINILNVKTYANDKWDSVDLEVKWSENLRNIPECIIFVLSENDDIIEGISSKYLKKLEKNSFKIYHFGLNSVKTLIYNKLNNLVLYSYFGNYTKNIVMNINIESPNYVRTLK